MNKLTQTRELKLGWRLQNGNRGVMYGKWDIKYTCILALKLYIGINPLRPNSDLGQTSHCNIKGLSVREVMRIKYMITRVKFYLYFNSFSPLLL